MASALKVRIYCALNCPTRPLQIGYHLAIIGLSLLVSVLLNIVLLAQGGLEKNRTTGDNNNIRKWSIVIQVIDSLLAGKYDNGRCV